MVAVSCRQPPYLYAISDIPFSAVEPAGLFSHWEGQKSVQLAWCCSSICMQALCAIMWGICSTEKKMRHSLKHLPSLLKLIMSLWTLWLVSSELVLVIAFYLFKHFRSNAFVTVLHHFQEPLTYSRCFGLGRWGSLTMPKHTWCPQCDVARSDGWFHHSLLSGERTSSEWKFRLKHVIAPLWVPPQSAITGNCQ